MPDQDPADSEEPSAQPEIWCPPTVDELGQLLPQFRIVELLGLGGMGAVYKAYQENLARFVAIKLLSTDYSRDEAFVVTFKNEARILAQLHHPRIIAIHDLGETSEGHLYFVMEYIEGVNLRTVLADGPLAQERALTLTSQICDALSAAHEKGIVHRDIKPENILIDEDGNVKLVDFGLAVPADAGPTGGVIMGTPDYSAPEVLEDDADHRSDLFALGVMLYEMLTGKVPAGAYQPASACVGCDVRIDRIVARAVQPNRETRYQSAKDFRTLVDHILTKPAVAGTPAAIPQSRPVSAPQPMPERRQGGLVKVLVIAAVLIGAVAFFLQKKKAPEGDTTAQPAAKPPAEEKAAPPKEIVEVPATPATPPPAPEAPVRKAISLIEGEAMTVVKVTSGETKIGPVERSTAVWSGHGYLHWFKGVQDDVLTLKFPVLEGGAQRVRAAFLSAKDYAVIEVTLNGKPVAGGPFDQQSAHLTLTGVRDLGVFELSQGEHQLEIKLAATHAGASFGLDYIQLEPPTRNEPPAAPGTDVALTAKASASRCAKSDHVKFINSAQDLTGIPADDPRPTRLTWYPASSGVDWAQYEWDLPQVIGECHIFWYMDNKSVAPLFWRILHREESGAWVPVECEFPEPVANEWSKVKFPAVKTTALRLHIQARDNRAAGVWTWKALAADPATVADPKQKSRPNLFLGELSPVHVKVNNRPYAANVYNNHENGKRAVFSAGKECTQYIWAHASSRLEFAIPDGYDRFVATGITASSNTGERLPSFGEFKLAVLVDGVPLLTSEPLSTYPKAELPVDVKFPVGSKRLTLITDNLDESDRDHAFWAYPLLLAGDGVPSKFAAAPFQSTVNPTASGAAPEPTGIAATIVNTRWTTSNEANQRAWGDLIFRASEFSTMNGSAGGWKATGPLTVELGTTYILQFGEELDTFVATTKDGTKIATGTLKGPVNAPPPPVGTGYKPVYETGFELPVFTQGAFQPGRVQAVCRTDLHWSLFNVGTNRIEPFTAGVGAQFFKTGKQALWVNAKATNKNRCGFSAVVDNPGGPILVSADVFIASSPAKTRWQFAVGDPEAPQGYVAGFNIDAEGQNIQLITPGGKAVNEPFKRDAWVRVQLRVDTSSQTFDVYLDGKNVAAGTPVYAATSRVRTFQFATAGDGDDRAFFDNFSFAVGQ